MKRIRVAVAIGCVGAALVACNSILGLDSYQETDDGGTNVDASRSDGASVDAGLDATSIDAPVIVLPPGANPATWANWPMPDRVTGSPNPPNYETVGLDGGVDGGGAVVDLVTKLTWLVAVQPVSSGLFEDAKTACASAAPAGTWRLPTRIELVSLLDHVNAEGGAPKSPTIDLDYFPGTLTQIFWTSSPVLPAQDPQPFWLVNFKDGSLTTSATDSALLARCVKGTGS